EQQRLRALAAWRELRAARRNLPRGWVLADEALRAIGRAAPSNSAALKALGVMPPSAADKLAPEIVAELERAAALPLDGLAQRLDARPSREEQALGRRLTDRLRSVALELGIAPEVLATQRDLRRIARGEPAAAVLRGWREAVLTGPVGEEIARG
ncbi:MAG TPA: HRDC domain-containing protein, partial [Steroidobacteraceae bacterium]|nr:HRDC domain-containing protein [Steroidobacteraceae bacterium]